MSAEDLGLEYLARSIDVAEKIDTEVQFCNFNDSKKIIFNKIVRQLTEEDLEDLKNSSPDFWWNDNDKIHFFSKYADGSFFCEKEKTIFDYRTREYKKIIYDFSEVTPEQLDEFTQIITEKFEELQIRHIQQKKEIFKEEVTRVFGYVAFNIRNVRKELLRVSDFMFLGDYQWQNEEEKQKWILYRQKLRDLTETPEWISGNLMDMKFPISPSEYKKLYPNEDVPYLDAIDADNQYVNRVIAAWKVKMIRNIANIGLPSLIDNANAFFDEDLDNYVGMLESINDSLKRIDATININDIAVIQSSIDISEEASVCADCTIPSF